MLRSSLSLCGRCCFGWCCCPILLWCGVVLFFSLLGGVAVSLLQGKVRKVVVRPQSWFALSPVWRCCFPILLPLRGAPLSLPILYVMLSLRENNHKNASQIELNGAQFGRGQPRFQRRCLSGALFVPVWRCHSTPIRLVAGGCVSPSLFVVGAAFSSSLLFFFKGFVLMVIIIHMIMIKSKQS